MLTMQNQIVVEPPFILPVLSPSVSFLGRLVNDIRFHYHTGQPKRDNVYPQFIFKDSMIHFVFHANQPIKKGEQVRDELAGRLARLHAQHQGAHHLLALAVLF